MKKIFSRDEIEIEAQTVKTFDNKIWVNLNDGRFILRESINWKKPVIRTSKTIYAEIYCVISHGKIIARRERESKLNLLRRLEKPKSVKKLL